MNRRGFTLIELLVVCVIIAVLIALLSPAVVQIRESSRRTQCKNNLKQIGLGLHNYQDVHGTFPPGWVNEDRSPEAGPSYGWMTMILPYIDSNPLYDRIDFDQFRATASTAENSSLEALAQRSVATFRCPSDTMPVLNPLRSGFATSNYSGNFGSQALPRLLPDRMGIWWAGAEPTPLTSDGLFFVNSKIRVIDVKDGTSNTAMVGERCVSSGAGIWLGVIQNQFENDQVTDCSHRSRINHSYSSFSSVHAGGAQMLLVDGSVAFISETIDSSDGSSKLSIFQKLACRNDGQPIAEF